MSSVKLRGNLSAALADPSRNVKVGSDFTERLRASLNFEVLADAGWDWTRQQLVPPVDHPTFGYRRCHVPECGRPGFRVKETGIPLCVGCRKLWFGSGVALDAFVTIPAPRRQHRGEPQRCEVPGCERTRWACPLCWHHTLQRRKRNFRFGRVLSIEEFATLPGIKGFPHMGRCAVAACDRQAAQPTRMVCRAHDCRWRKAGHESGLELADWAARESGVNAFEVLNMRGMEPGAQLEMLVLIQAFIDRRNHFPAYRLQGLADRVRAGAVPSLLALSDADIRGWPGELPAVVRLARLALRRASTTIEEERAGDGWDLTLWGHHGAIDFRPITQTWLRETTKTWAAHDLPRRRTKRTIPSTTAYVLVAGRLSRFLRTRADRGDDPAALGRADVEGFLAWLARSEASGKVSSYTRHYHVRKLKMMLEEARSLGLHQRGGPMEGLPEGFAVRRDDMTAVPSPYDPGRALPQMVLDQMRAGADRLEEWRGRDWRVARDLLELTGRRPEEVCGLAWDCLHQSSSTPREATSGPAGSWSTTTSRTSDGGFACPSTRRPPSSSLAIRRPCASASPTRRPTNSCFCRGRPATPEASCP
ncbi:MAG TPA: hypothetical protein VF045_00765 [Acidimicrobiales bacterium]